MDPLEKLISEKRAERNALAERGRLLDAEISALETAARLRPAAGATPARPSSSLAVTAKRSGGGRRPGDISMQWRAILADIHEKGGVESYDQIAKIAAVHGAELALSSVRDRVRNLIGTGLIERGSDESFCVTKMAVERFGFTKENAAPEGAADTGA